MSQLVTPFPPNIDYKKQSIVVPGTKKAGETGHYRNSIWPGELKSGDSYPVQTLYEAFQSGYKEGPGRDCFGSRPVISTSPLKFANHYEFQSYQQISDRRLHLGSAIESLFLQGTVGGGGLPTVGIWCNNRPEWQIIDLAIHAYSKVGVSLYDTLGPESVEYIIQHAELTLVFAAAVHIPALLSLGDRAPNLRAIASVDDLSSDAKRVLTAWAKTRNIKIFEFRELEAMGKSNPIPPIIPAPSTIATICYTSGTTNVPKGVVLTHGNMTLACRAMIYGLDHTQSGCLFSYLPLAHIYGRIMELCAIMLGGKIGYFTGDPLRLLEDAQALKPTLFPSVPRVLNRIYMVAQAAAADPGVKGALLRKAVETKLKNLRETGSNKHALWDRLVFRKFQAVLGGKIELITSGSAPISGETIDFLKIAFACDVVEGYGMTENCGTCTRTLPGDMTCGGTTGIPQVGISIKLVDVPAMGYTSEDKPNPRGEICCRSDYCFGEYYKDPKNTSDAIDKDGWLHTGDVGEFDECGRLKIIDRVKNIMKLSQGEYVALEKIEMTYTTCPLVSQIYVHGDPLQDHLLAVVVPDPPALVALARSLLGRGDLPEVKPEDYQALKDIVREHKIVEAVQRALDKESQKAGLRGFERVKRVYLSTEPFTTENGLMTPTFKVRRKDAERRYKQELAALYALGAPASSPTTKL